MAGYSWKGFWAWSAKGPANATARIPVAIVVRRRIGRALSTPSVSPVPSAFPYSTSYCCDCEGFSVVGFPAPAADSVLFHFAALREVFQKSSPHHSSAFLGAGAVG